MEAECLLGAKQGFKHPTTLQLPSRKGQCCLQILGDSLQYRVNIGITTQGGKDLSCDANSDLSASERNSHNASVQLSMEMRRKELPDLYSEQVV